ncbi:DUF2061 domain-containing protein [Halobaculum sp. CBA1158]|uniref:DUF2061 domain-containing protein n=1 Tax=Halobaculum sp. CBA1158 TaxID=2904243 RepID=UPI001F40C85B|nr:DUF2061 domain-containing protein [Halobaculum sp. CBA1158]UIO99493.1 DUF2061 domain-containing protein [Halobaculum sp. CBA1158]
MGRLPLPRSPLQHRKRAIVKTLCYRALMVAITVIVAWMVVGDVSDAVNIGLVANVVKTATYYTYERVWDRISWGVTDTA